MAWGSSEDYCRIPAARRIVAYVQSQDRPLSIKEIAEATGLALNSVQALFATLQRQGYVERVIRATPKGTALLTQ